jgi:RNA polymerase sporulation-specific sigma factor
MAGRSLLVEQIGKLMARLPEKEQFIMEAVYLQDKQPKTVAESLDVSLPYVYRLQKRGIRRIRGMVSRFMHKND